MRRLLLFGLVALAACDSAVDPPGEGETPAVPSEPVTLAPQPQVALSPGTFRASLTASGRISTVGIYNEQDNSSYRYTEYDPIYAAGLWLAGTQDGDTRVNALYYDDDVSAYGACGDGTDGVFALSADSTYRADGWPVSVGAPTTASGAPRVYGDEMLWTSLCSVPSQPRTLLDRPVAGLRVNLAVFRYDADPLSLYLRYELRNEGTQPAHRRLPRPVGRPRLG